MVSPKVSAVIPAYNVEQYLADAIESCLAQSHAPFEVIVVNDGSTDGTRSVAESFGARVRVVTQENRGESAARNRGIEEASGEWVAFLDADDRWESNKLARQLAACDNPGVVGCHTNFRHFGAGDDVWDGTCVPESTRYTLTNVAAAGPLLPSSLMVRRNLPIRFPETVRAAADVLYSLDLVQAGRVVLVPEVLVAYRRHAQNMSSKASFVIEAHQRVLAWANAHRDLLGKPSYDAIHMGLLNRVLWSARTAKWQRRWDDFDAISRHLRSYASEPSVSEFLAKWRLPPAVYQVKDFVAGNYWWLRQRLKLLLPTPMRKATRISMS